MYRELIRYVLGCVAGIFVWTGMALAAPPLPATPPGPDQVVLTYFHRTLRCETCRLIEDLTGIAVTRNLFKEIEAGTLIWRPVNIDQPENAHFLTDFKLEGQALVLASYKGGQLQDWRILEEVWNLYGDPAAFDVYVRDAVRAFLAAHSQVPTTSSK
jgi:hypothetical protein